MLKQMEKQPPLKLKSASNCLVHEIQSEAIQFGNPEARAQDRPGPGQKTYCSGITYILMQQNGAEVFIEQKPL